MRPARAAPPSRRAGRRRPWHDALRRASRDERLRLPERHLGLVQAEETHGLDARLDALADFVEANLDVDGLASAAEDGIAAQPAGLQPAGVVGLAPPAQRIAIARDAAFSFFYPHHAESWRAAGAALTFFSPLANEAPPEDCDLVWLPGGYPGAARGANLGSRKFPFRLEALRATRMDPRRMRGLYDAWSRSHRCGRETRMAWRGCSTSRQASLRVNFISAIGPPESPRTIVSVPLDVCCADTNSIMRRSWMNQVRLSPSPAMPIARPRRLSG